MSRVVWQRFESVLADPITRYLAAKRSMGCRFNTEDRHLRLLDRYLVDQGIQRIGDVTASCLDAFLASRQRAHGVSFNDLLGVVRRLLEWMVDQQELATSPLTTKPQRQSARSLPYLFEPETIRRILDYAAELPDWPRCRHRGPTSRRYSRSSQAWVFASARSRACSAATLICRAKCFSCVTANSAKAGWCRLVLGSQRGYDPTPPCVNSASDFLCPMPRSSHGTDAPRS
jgi:hypothetical protein